MSEIVLPGGVAVKTPSEVEMLQAVTQNQMALHRDLLGIMQQLDILIRLECGADKRSTWKAKLLEMDVLSDAADEANDQVQGPDLKVVPDEEGETMELPFEED